MNRGDHGPALEPRLCYHWHPLAGVGEGEGEQVEMVLVLVEPVLVVHNLSKTPLAKPGPKGYLE
jgi:hypothetical protein